LDKIDPETKAVMERLTPRHKPKQNRSRLRFQALLDAAEEVIAESGLHGLAMREVARRANSPIGSVYHYFPSTTALIRALLEQQFDKLNSIIESGLQAHFPLDGDDFRVEHVAPFIDDIADFFFNTPSVAELWAGLHAYPELRALNIEDTKKNAALLEPILSRFLLVLEPQQVSATAVVLVEWVSATLRFATTSPPDVRVQLVDALKSLVTLLLTGLLQPAGGMNADRSNPLSKQANAPLPIQGARRGKNPPGGARKKRP
jgi:AcrR family transcriptional regulator